ncbi:MAG: N-acetylmuramoyl-L-alanine amidase [Bacteroidia bacterium]|nr:N-acetylmuramoyl-L-alanine amidase [Bacteroidia bacterium]
MRALASLFVVLVLSSSAQNLLPCKQRFNTYLNFRGKLNPVVTFENNAIYFKNAAGKKELAIYDDEIPALALYFENSSNAQQKNLLALKALNHFKKNQLDSLTQLYSNKKISDRKKNNAPLQGFRIALDPGHFATTLAEAASEQKYLYFLKPAAGQKPDTIKIFESELTFNTATLVKKMLEEQGATVMLTRSEANHTSFNCTFTYWIKQHKKRTLDSLKNSGALSSDKYAKLIKAKVYNLFWDFFRDYDLGNRVAKINAFNPHVTAVIHYNVDEKNAPWKKTSLKDFTMTFIGGAFAGDDLVRDENRADFVRLLISNQLNRSEELSAETVLNFNKNLGIRIATATDAEYLAKNCNTPKSAGVFSRNLVLCRKINSPLVYGEALYQDNENECLELMKKDRELYGIKTNARLEAAAKSYYEALLKFLNNY